MAKFNISRVADTLIVTALDGSETHLFPISSLLVSLYGKVPYPDAGENTIVLAQGNEKLFLPIEQLNQIGGVAVPFTLVGVTNQLASLINQSVTPILVIAPAPGVDPVVYDYYISVQGSDGNDGTSLATAVKSIAKLQALATAKGNGVKIKFAEATLYRERLDLESLSGVLVNVNYSTLNAADVVAKNAGLWTQPDVANYPNVWQISWSLASISESFAMTIDSQQPIFMTSIAEVNTTVNSYWVATPDMANGSPITVYVNAATNPNTNSSVYELAKRRTGLSIGPDATVTKMIGRTQTQNDGSLYATGNVTLSKLVLAFGHKHNLFFGKGSAIDVITWASDGHPNGVNPFVIYLPDPTGINASLTRCMALSPRKQFGDGFYGHGNPGTHFGTLTFDQCAVVGYVGFGVPSCTSQAVTNSFGNVLYPPGADYAVALSVERSLFKTLPGDAAYLTLGGDYSAKNMALHINESGYAGVLNFGSLTSLLFEKCTFAGANKQGVHGGSTSGNAPVTIRKTVFGFDPLFVAHLQLGPGTYVGDYNIFWQNSYTQTKLSKNGVEYLSLADWQTATGQDTHSVYVTQAQRAGFWLGDPSQGDFRISPMAKVTAANGTVYTGTFPDGTPLTAAGVQESWDFKARQVVQGPPTRWPILPASYDQSVQYVKQPDAWVF